MKKNLIKIINSLAFTAVILSCLSMGQPNHQDETGPSIAERRKFERSDNAAIEKRIDDLLAKMTLEEKIGQMTQINNSEIVTNAQWGNGADLKIEIKVDTAKLGKLLRK